ncbi:hypothetical protein QTJ16_004168 [Diplocarpon rosae]|uniref:Uncharacterized protein n=1 Tax=Diplocarpon rosae TaxID=946125 RepID=A0AAD9SYR2_9HELO|nr:hypothetical protein QTJ16_004168 [Diplocarpon rosae]
MRYFTLVASILSLFTRSTHASVTCNFNRLEEPGVYRTDCTMAWVDDNNAWRANCGWGTFDWAEGSGSQHGKITTVNFREEETLYFSFHTIQDNGESRWFASEVGPGETCTMNLNPRTIVERVTADF